jgi:hypothetical protein
LVPPMSMPMARRFAAAAAGRSWTNMSLAPY